MAKKLKNISAFDVTFKNSKNVPFQRWYPYIEGYSPNFVLSLIDKYCNDATLIYEPFAGTGTTLFASDMKGINTVYSEVNPLLRFLIDTKISVMTLSEKERMEMASELKKIIPNVLVEANNSSPSEELKQSYTNAFGDSIYLPDEQYILILKLRTYIDSVYNSNQKLLADLLTVAVLSSLLSVSYLKKQGDVRFKTQAERANQEYLVDVLPSKLELMVEDIKNLDFYMSKKHTLVCENAKNIGLESLEEKISAVITSPPYLNGTNYFRNTKLELWFLGYIKTDRDLRYYRDEALTSGINDVKASYSKDCEQLNSKTLTETLLELDSKAYDKRIPLMARCYFNEMIQLFGGLADKLKEGAYILVDLGDSIFSNVHIKTDVILAEVLRDLGYKLKDRIVLRQRRSRNGELISQVLLVMKYNSKNGTIKETKVE